MIWRSIASSVTGRSHLLRNENGQDYCRAGTIWCSGREIFIGLVSDGAGSTIHGGTGAKIACDTIYSGIAEAIGPGFHPADITTEDILRWIGQARDAIEAEAAGSGTGVRDYACTLIGAIAIDRDYAVFFQVGDGAIVVGDNDKYETVFWPQQGEYSNTTFFITDDTFRGSLSVAFRSVPLRKLALFSDGIQNLALSYTDRSVHTGFFNPLFEYLDSNGDFDDAVLAKELGRFLSRDDLNARNDDDKTLILALCTPDLT